MDFKQQLRRQCKFIKNSCELYDEGDVEEAVRIAVNLRVLFHDTAHSVSLLTQLGAERILMLSTAMPYRDCPPMPNLYLIRMVANLNLTNANTKADFRCKCQPLLEEARWREKIPFKFWWSKELVIKHHTPRTAYTRRGLVLAAANTDGGAHVDPKTNPTYDYVKAGSGLEVEVGLHPRLALPPQKAAFENVHFATLRQIAYEVLNSPALLALAQN